MTRYLRLFAYFVRFSLSRAMEFRLDFFFRIVMDLFYYAVNIAFYRVIFIHVGQLGGWDEHQIMIFVSAYLLVDAINMTLFSNNLWWLPTYINRGDLDYYVLRPVSSLFFVSLRDFAANSFVNLVMACGIAAWAFATYPAHVGFAKIVLFFLLVVNGTFLFYLTHILVLIPVFWTHSGRGFEMIYWAVDKLAERPDRIFTGWVRRIVVSLIPMALVASFPARLAVEVFDWRILVHIIVVTAVYFAAVVALWRKGLEAYSSASS